MNKHSLVIYSKSNSGWNINSTGAINANVIGLSSKDQARYIWYLIKAIYSQGRYDEFKDNNNKTNKLMERFGL